ncbi:acyl-CoA synthetase [Nocardia vermiculata]|uniref:Acyl-CoA synthetase n=1 Tax=Nocardia vermiculata TaxID=257274 RepID=A0A846XWR8_9NOCA|nr:acyl-CoA synthetase [Nocardia vermiculata]NKY50135.1 acyl-CoA synthetase [Nocardia vermiculata]
MPNNFADLFEHAADAMPDRVALIQGERQVTYRELEHRSNQLAHHLAAAGLGQGSHIGFHMHNSIETMETLIASFKLRAVPININYRYGADELRYVYDNADLDAVVHHRCYSAVVDEVRPQIATLRHALVVEDDQGGTGLPSTSTPYAEAFENTSTARDFDERSPDDLFMMYTGGTTGMPKGVMWRQEDMWRVLGGGIDFYTNVPVADEFEQSRSGAQNDPLRWLILPPLIHASAMMPTFTGLWSGQTVIYEPRFDPDRIWQVVNEQRANVMVITGDAMARPLLQSYQENPVDVATMVVLASGAALLSQPVKNRLLETFPHAMISDSIGSSETGFGGMGVAQKDDDPGRGPRVQTGRGAVVVDDEGREVPGGQEGWMAKTGSVPIGYYKDQAKSDKLFRTVDGVRMVITDDRARVEDDGSITLLGRGNMVINTGGEKVFVEEVESVVKSHDGIFDVVVIGVPHERWGHQVAAVVSMSSGEQALDFGALEAHVRKHLAGYKLPRSIWVVDVVGRTPSGKPDYRWAKSYAESQPPAYIVGS